MRVRAVSSRKVLIKCSGTDTVRATEASSATHSKSTIAAPIRASTTIATPDRTAARRAW